MAANIPVLQIDKRGNRDTEGPCALAKVMGATCVHVHVCITLGRLGFRGQAETSDVVALLPHEQGGRP